MNKWRGTSVFNAFYNIKKRCYDITNKNYSDYGGRGITLAEDLSILEDFIEYIQSLPNFEKFQSGEYWLDREDNDKGYQKDNIRLCDKSTQAMNKRLGKNNKSGYRGVFYTTGNGKWTAVVVNQKVGGRKHIKHCDTPLEAAKAYNEFVIKHNLENQLNKL